MEKKKLKTSLSLGGASLSKQKIKYMLNSISLIVNSNIALLLYKLDNMKLSGTKIFIIRGYIMNELVGFVNANSVRQKVLSLLSSKGEMEGERIAKTLRVVYPTIAKTLEELEEKELIVKKEELYYLTETGIKVEKMIQQI
jgi:predicted transcriptional regulator